VIVVETDRADAIVAVMSLDDQRVRQRTIHLRRPATLSVVEEPFVPQGPAGLLEEIERRWAALRQANPAYFDGRLYHVIGVHRNGYGGAILHVADCAYRFHAVQDDDFDLGVRPLGVKGITMRGGRVLLGRRSMRVARYGGLWEFAPGGVVDPGELPVETVRRELMEEAGLRTNRAPTPIAVIHDPCVRSWEIVFRIALEEEAVDLTPDGEYDEMTWSEPDDQPGPLTPAAERMVPLLRRSAR
jgi:8-oxo-dGTP pyrophosphatase MutT (NUDIX family)